MNDSVLAFKRKMKAFLAENGTTPVEICLT
jgi:hypothetical protein